MEDLSIDNKRRDNALRHYYTKRYGDKAEEMMKKNRDKKDANIKLGKVYKERKGRPKVFTEDDLRKKRAQLNLMGYYRKRYGDKAEEIYKLQLIKKSLTISSKTPTTNTVTITVVKKRGRPSKQTNAEAIAVTN